MVMLVDFTLTFDNKDVYYPPSLYGWVLDDDRILLRAEDIEDQVNMPFTVDQVRQLHAWLGKYLNGLHT